MGHQSMCQRNSKLTKGGTNLDFFRGVQVALERCYPALAVTGIPGAECNEASDDDNRLRWAKETALKNK